MRVFLFAAIGFCILGGRAAAGTLPDTITVTVKPFYRFRPDGKPGREILLRFKGKALRGETSIEIACGTKTETSILRPPAAGLDSTTILLPPETGVRDSASVRLILRQGEHAIEEMVHVPPMRHWTVYVYPHSHVDIGYSNTQANVEFIHKRNIDEGMKLAEATRNYPEGSRYLWNTEVMWPFERYYATASADRKKRLIRAVQKGEICLDAAYVNELTTAMSDEEMIQSLRPAREAARLTGKPVDTYVQVDVPGMAWGMVQVMAHEGVRYVMMMPNAGRGNDSMVSQFRYRPFWWVGQDGKSRVLFLNAGSYGAGMEKGGKTGRPWFGQRDRSKIPDEIKTDNPRADFLDHHLSRELPDLEKAEYPYDMFVVTWAMWDNALIDADLPEAVRSWNREYAYPHLVISSAHSIMETFEKRYGDRLPVMRGDFSDYWTDSFGTFARETRLYMNARERLVQAETLWPMLHAAGDASRGEFDEAWRNVVMCTEHTFAAENPAEPFFQDAIWEGKQRYFMEADYRSRVLIADALAPATDKSNGALGPAEGPSLGGVAVLNTNSWAHGGLVTLQPAESQKGDRVVDDRGRVLISQRLSTGELLFLAPDIPAFGSGHFRVVAGSGGAGGNCRFADTVLDNGKLLVQLNRKTGTIVRLIDRTSGRNFADSDVNGGLNAFRWQPARGAGEARSDTVTGIYLKESGPLAGEVVVTSRAPGCRSVTRSVRLISGEPWVEITDVVDKLPLIPKDGIHIGFGFALPGAKTSVDIPWGVMRMEDDQWPAANRAWMTAGHFVDISNDTAGVTWCSLDAPLFESGSITGNNTAGWDGKGDVWPGHTPPSPTIYSWVMNNHWFTNTPLTQEGPVLFRYRILPHGRFDAAEANRFGVEQCQPLVPVAADKDPIAKPLLAVANGRVAVTMLKSAADGKGMLLRLRSLSEKDKAAGLSWPAGQPRSVALADPEGDAVKEVVKSDVVVPAMGFVTLIVMWGSSR
ncbi:MAG TPA: glycosyl hydrolase [Bacteroidota bacterium]|nr:glycosyl hydrolase [Bacteroidota bacterium]